jgi:hypothetical protein
VKFDWDQQQLDFIRSHVWAVLATGRIDGSPQPSMVGYVDDDVRLVVSAKTFTAKWKNAVRQPKVGLTVPDGRAHLVVYVGTLQARSLEDRPRRGWSAEPAVRATSSWPPPSAY